jgi:predicted kinase
MNRPSAAKRGYGRRWRKLRARHIASEPLCRECRKLGRVRAGEVVDHIRPHDGREALLYDETNLQTLCKRCHDSWKQRIEAGSTLPSPTFEGRQSFVSPKRSDDLFWPTGMRPSAVPLVIIYGPPASGKSTYIRERAAPEDIVVDLDDIVAEICGSSRERSKAIRYRALTERNRRLAGLWRARPGRRAWFATTAARKGLRASLERQLRPVEVVVMDTPLEECVRRIRADLERPAREHEELARRWWRDWGRGGGKNPKGWISVDCLPPFAHINGPPDDPGGPIPILA